MLITILVGIIILAIVFFAISMFPDANLQNILKLISILVFLIWLIGVISGRNFLGGHL